MNNKRKKIKKEKLTIMQAIANGLAKNKDLSELLDKKVGLYGGYWLRSELVKEGKKEYLKIWTEFDENRYAVVDEDFPND